MSDCLTCKHYLLTESRDNQRPTCLAFPRRASLGFGSFVLLRAIRAGIPVFFRAALSIGSCPASASALTLARSGK